MACEDPCTDPFPKPIWGSIDAASDDRVTWEPGSLLEPSYRRLTVLDGDDFYGERCELGHNERRYGEIAESASGTFALYNEGETKRTVVRMRLPTGFPAEVNAWQVVLQQKQTQPYDPCGNVPMVSVQVWGSLIRLCLADPTATENPTVWSCAAMVGKWFTLRVDGFYSTTDSAWTRLSVRAGVWSQRSPKVYGPNLLAGCTTGESIPAHLRAGIYHSPTIPACSVDIAHASVVSV